jgi:hypothetical protein
MYGTIYLEDGFELEVYGNGLLQATGAGASYLNTFMHVDASQWATHGDAPQEYYLLIDRSGTGDFLPGHVEFYMPDSVDSHNRLYFSHVSWDTDHNGKDRFCFAKVPFDSLFTSNNLVVHGGANDALSKNRDRKPHIKQPQSPEQPVAKNNYVLYPNPHRGKFTVEVHYAEVSDITIKTYAPDGTLVSSWSSQNERNYRYEGEVWVVGHYMIDIEGGGERKSLKMIVQ